MQTRGRLGDRQGTHKPEPTAPENVEAAESDTKADDEPEETVDESDEAETPDDGSSTDDDDKPRRRRRRLHPPPRAGVRPDPPVAEVPNEPQSSGDPAADKPRKRKRDRTPPPSRSRSRGSESPPPKQPSARRKLAQLVVGLAREKYGLPFEVSAADPSFVGIPLEAFADTFIADRQAPRTEGATDQTAPMASPADVQEQPAPKARISAGDAKLRKQITQILKRQPKERNSSTIIAQQLGKKSGKILRLLQAMKEEGLVTMSGWAKHCRWEIRR